MVATRVLFYSSLLGDFGRSVRFASFPVQKATLQVGLK